MAQVSKYPISEKVYLRIWEVFIKTLINVKNSQDATDLVSDLLTPIERVMLAKRLAIALLLDKGYTYKEIIKILKVSSPTIAMVSISLKHGSNGYKKMIDRLIKDEQFQENLNQFGQKMLELPAAGTKGSGGFRYLRDELRRSSQDKKPF